MLLFTFRQALRLILCFVFCKVQTWHLLHALCHELLDHLKISIFYGVCVCVCVVCVRVVCMFLGSSSPHGDMFSKSEVQMQPTSFLPDDDIH